MFRSKGLLLVTMEPPASLEDEFNDWYDTEHFPQRRGLPGFESASRWVCIEGWPRWAALYDSSRSVCLIALLTMPSGSELYQPVDEVPVQSGRRSKRMFEIVRAGMALWARRTIENGRESSAIAGREQDQNTPAARHRLLRGPGPDQQAHEL